MQHIQKDIWCTEIVVRVETRVLPLNLFLYGASRLPLATTLRERDSTRFCHLLRVKSPTLESPPSLNLTTFCEHQQSTSLSQTTMSSPSGHRRQRSSQSATPKRSSRSSRAIPSSPPDPAAAQLQSEAASSQGNGTPRRAPPSSSPMNYRSSPADIARMNRERDVSSPLRQMTNTQTTQDGERTPRATTGGPVGGESQHTTNAEISN